MALVKCEECGKEISTDAKDCQHCGAKPPAKTKLATWAVGLFSVAIIGSCISTQDDARQRAAKIPLPTQEQIAATKKADDELNAAIATGKAIRSGMKNPKSFDLESFLIFPGGATCYEYRATNSFNAVVPGKAVFDPAKNTVFTSDANKNNFVKAWNQICTNSGGKEHVGGLKLLSIF